MNAILEQINSAGSTFVEFAGPMLVQSSALIIILLLLDLVLRKKLRAVFRYWIWMLVLVKVILPTTLSTPLSVGYWFGDELAVVKVSDTANAPQATEAALSGVSNEAPIVTAQPATDTVMTEAGVPLLVLVTQISWEGVVFLVWLAVTAGMAFLLLQRAIFVNGLVAQGRPANSLMNDTLDFCCTKMGVKGKVGLKVSPSATSPAVCGLFRPVILVPQDLGSSLGAGGLRTVLMHELAHIKRADLWVNLAQTLLQIVYFYNPLLWLANWVIRRVREQAVDETVLVAMGEKAQQYPETLVNVAKLAFKRPALSLRLIGVVESKNALAGRIKHILERPIPKSAKLGAAGLLAVVIAGTVLLPMAKAKDRNQKPEARNQRTEANAGKVDSKFAATLANGVTVELVGVCDYPEGKPRCWQPDGSRLEKQIYVYRERDYSDEKYGFIIKVDGPAGLSFAWNKIEGSKGWWGSCKVLDEKGSTLEGFNAAIIKGYDGRETTNIRVGIATGPWKTKAGSSGRSMTTTGNKNILFSQAYESGNFVGITVSSPWCKYQVERIVATDKSGQVHVTKNIGSVASGEIDQMTAKFYGLKLHQVKEFQFQTRPYEWVTFKNVSLKPSFKTDVQVEVQSAGEKEQPAEAVDSGGAGGTGMNCSSSGEDSHENKNNHQERRQCD